MKHPLKLILCHAFALLGVFSLATPGMLRADDFTALPQAPSYVEYSAQPTYRTLSFPLQDSTLGLIGFAGMAGFVMSQSVDGEVQPNYHIGGTRAGSQWVSTLGEAMALSAPLMFYTASTAMQSGSVQQRQAQRVSRQLLRGLTLTLASVYTLKYSVSRTRPNGSDEQSFPSAHTAESFAVATTLGLNYGWRVGLPAYLAAAAIGASRYDLQMHYVSDIVTGAGIGALFAYVSHWIERPEKDRRGKSTVNSWSLLPSLADSSYALRLQWSM